MVKPWLFLPPKWAHDLSPFFLKTYSRLHSSQKLIWSPFKWRGLEFSNPLGIAGGVDKNADCVPDWWRWGPGFLEIGTVVPEPQKILPGPNMKRWIKSKTVWNRMGFPSKGLNYVYKNLKSLSEPHYTPLFINVGKNRSTPLERAQDDYLTCMKQLQEVADGFVINISSPNTEKLRDLLKPEKLKNFLQPLIDYRDQAAIATPLLLKLSPDIGWDQWNEILDVTLWLDIDGWVLTNSTQQRAEDIKAPEGGGFSGKALQELSQNWLTNTVSYLGARKKDRLLVSVGGVLTPQDVFERLDAGADLVQVYSALIFEGPGFFRKVAGSTHGQNG